VHRDPKQLKTAELPQFAAEAGYFKVQPRADRAEGESWGGLWHKNLDFLRLKDFALFLLQPGPDKKIIDVGCANGVQMVYCGLAGASVFGQDLDSDAVAAANDKLSQLKLSGEAKVGDARQLSFDSDFFDAAISSDFQEHLPNDVAIDVLREVRRVLKPGGKLVIKTPNFSYLRLSRRYKQLRLLARRESPRGVLIPHSENTDDPQHVGLITRWRLSKQLLSAGFQTFSFYYAPLRRFGYSSLVEVASTELPGIRDLLSEEIFCVAVKPLALSHFPE
jgi:SAM-dependent methyltransferase